MWHGQCLSPQWGFVHVDGGSLKLFQNRCSFLGFPVDCLLKDNTIMSECLMKVSFKFVIIVTILFSLLCKVTIEKVEISS